MFITERPVVDCFEEHFLDEVTLPSFLFVCLFFQIILMTFLVVNDGLCSSEVFPFPWAEESFLGMGVLWERNK